jgi:signal transduction histidine kinase
MKKPFWNARTRLLLTLELVVLPAAALVIFSVLHLKSIQRDRAVEAAFQRDFQQMLAISDKGLTARAYEMVDTVRPKFPCPATENASNKLDKIVVDNPWMAYAFIYDKLTGTMLSSQPGKMDDPEFRRDGEKLEKTVQSWFDVEGEPMLEKMRKMQSKGDAPYIAFSNFTYHGDQHSYQNVLIFPVEAAGKSRVTLGGVAFDGEYLQREFFPESLKDVMSDSGVNAAHENSLPKIGMMLHPYRDPEPIVASGGWDGGHPEVEHKLEGAFPDLILAIKYKGTTIEAITRRFLRTSYFILGGISLLLLSGLYFTYRSVFKTMELAKLKSDIVSNVSHELRTPLSLIRLYAETLELGRIPDEQKQLDYYRIIRKESERLTALINNILDFSRIEAGKKEYEFRDTDLSALVRSTLDAYRYQIEQNGFAYEEHITDELPPVRVDREAIARSLLNLVNNAIKYSSQDRYLAVSLYRTNGSVKLDVQDHGIGIPRSEQQKIFDKFYRVCDPLCHENKGSGLGLSLVRHIVDAHGGEVSVESIPGKGSTFSIVLPLHSAVPTQSSGKTDEQVHTVGA